MTDIVERLCARWTDSRDELSFEAAEEIRRLCTANEYSFNELAATRAEIERLREQVASLQASSGYEASIAQIEIERLRALVKDLADDLEAELNGHYPPEFRENYPSEQRRYERDMANVYVARKLLQQRSNRDD